MKHLITILQKLYRQKDFPKPMGRWNIEHCNKKMDRKIDLSNEDHCGPCGQYILGKLELQNKNNSHLQLEKTKS
jgi:hypothetical protein